jgi:hypothetical protein
MLAAVSGLTFLLSTLLKLDSSLGYLLPLPVAIAALRSGVGAAWKTMLSTSFLLVGGRLARGPAGLCWQKGRGVGGGWWLGRCSACGGRLPAPRQTAGDAGAADASGAGGGAPGPLPAGRQRAPPGCRQPGGARCHQAWGPAQAAPAPRWPAGW